MAGEVRVVVYDSRIQAMSAPGGMVYRYASDKGRKAAAYAKEEAPKRTRYLANNIRHDTRTVRNGAVSRARSTAYYSTWVHEGTGDVEGKAMWMPKWKGGTLRVWRYERAGQKANPFMLRGLRMSMATPYLSRSPRITGNPFG